MWRERRRRKEKGVKPKNVEHWKLNQLVALPHLRLKFSAIITKWEGDIRAVTFRLKSYKSLKFDVPGTFCTDKKRNKI